MRAKRRMIPPCVPFEIAKSLIKEGSVGRTQAGHFIGAQSLT